MLVRNLKNKAVLTCPTCKMLSVKAEVIDKTKYLVTQNMSAFVLYMVVVKQRVCSHPDICNLAVCNPIFKANLKLT